MNDSTEGMTPAERAEAYEAEAARIIDKVTGRGYWSGEPSKEAVELVDLLVQAASARTVEAMRQMLDNAAMANRAPKALTPQESHFADQIDGLLERVKRIETAPARCPETWQPAVGGDVGRCTLPTGHTGKHLMASQSGVPWAHPGEVCHDSPERRAQAADRVEYNVGVHKATDG
jgi:hypothetical protein